MDVLGAPSNPATFDAVCGEARGLENVTLIKKPGKQGNTDWNDSRGTNATDCDWVVKDANDLSDIGQHTPSAVSDSTAPVITLTGNQIVEVALNGSYSDAGATASDDTDGTITGDIVTGNSVDTAVAGTYAVTYNVNDAASNAAVQVVRTVIVDPWNFNGSKQSWTGSGGVSVAAGTTYATLTFVGPGKNYPNFDSSASANVNTAAGRYVAVTLKNNSLNTKYAMAVMVGSSPKWATTLTSQTTLDSDFKTVYFDMQTAVAAANWTGTRQKLRFRASKVDGSVGVAAGTIFIDKIAVVPVKDTTAPTLSAVSIASSNASSTVAGVGDVVTLTMTANESIKTPVVTFKSGGAAVSDSSVTYTHTSGDTWTAAYTVESGDTAGSVSYSIAFNDTRGNSGTAVTSGSGSVSMDASPTITKSIVSAVNDGVTALGSVSANETVTWSISGSGVSISSSGVVTLDSAANYQVATSHSFTINATDSIGNVTSTGALSVSVVDATAPTITSGIVSSVNDGDTALGSMSSNEAVTWSITGSGVSISSSGAVTLDSAANAGSATSHSFTVTATDGSGNATTTGTLSVSVVDTTGPIITTSSIVSSVNDGVTALGSVSANETVTWSISGSGVSISSSGVVTLDSAANYQVATSHSFTINATDSIGNVTSTGALSVSVVDATAPTITSGIVSSVNDGDTALGSMSSNEAVTWSITGSGVSISSSGAVTLDSAANAGSATSHSFTVTATDGSGNATTTGTLSVPVVDTTAPVISLVGNAVVSLELGTAYSDAGATATDTKDGTVTSSITTVSDVDVNTVGTYTVTYNVADVAGNTATQVTRTVNVGSDTTIPVISLVGSASVDVERANAYSDLGATATDNVDGTITSSIVTVNGVDVTTSGTYTVTYDVNDAAGNAATQVTRVVTVADTTPPGLTVANLNLNVADGATALGNVSADESVTWSVTGSGVSISSSGSVTLDSPADYLVRTSYSFEITATDAYGNFRRIPVIVVVDDITAPLFDYSGLVTSINDGGTALGSVSANEPVTWSISGSGVSISSEGTITLDSPANYVEAQSHQYRVSATDKQGGAGRIGYDFIVEVIDITAPTFDYSGLLGTIYEGTTALGSMSANEPVNWTISGSGVSISSSGVVTLDSPASYEVATFHKYRVSATDKQGGAGRTGYLWTAAVEPSAITLVIPDDRVVKAVGYLTGVNLDPEGIAGATDGDGNAIDIVADQTGPFQSGNYDIEWSATSAGGTVSATQSLKIHPLVNLATAIKTTEGDSLDIEVLLSGQAADYPVTVPFAVSGTAVEGEDYSVGSTGSVTITEGTMASVSLSITADDVAESEESVVITLGEATNAALGLSREQVITILEENLPPQVALQVSQDGVVGSSIAQDAGTAMINPEVDDANATDTYTVDWTNAQLMLPEASVVIVDGEGAGFPYEMLEFDPADLTTGVYVASVDVSDGVNSVSAAVSINILAQAPVLSEETDSDGDGISDADEGAGDSDGDGIPDYEDNINVAYVAYVANTLASSTGVIQSEPGTTLMLGGIALGLGNNNVMVTESEIAATENVAEDQGYDYIADLIDFAVTGAEFGHSYSLVVPLTVALPEGAVYRKYSAPGGWVDFIENATNGLSSTMAVEGICPELGSDVYIPGLTAGDDCLQLLIEDGGPNDADGVANGTLVDSSSIAIKYIGTPSDSSEINLSSAQLTANGSASTTVTVTVLDAEGVGLEHMSVSASVAVSGVGVGTFVEQGSGVYTATLTAGNTAGSAAVVAVIDNGEASVTVSSDPITLKAVTPPSSGGGGGCTVATDGSADASLLLLLIMAGLLLARRRYQLR